MPESLTLQEYEYLLLETEKHSIVTFAISINCASNPFIDFNKTVNSNGTLIVSIIDPYLEFVANCNCTREVIVILNKNLNKKITNVRIKYKSFYEHNKYNEYIHNLTPFQRYDYVIE